MKIDDKELTPFEKARINVYKTAENFNFYNSVELLVGAIAGLEAAQNDVVLSELETMCDNIIKELSLQLDKDGAKWN